MNKKVIIFISILVVIFGIIYFVFFNKKADLVSPVNQKTEKQSILQPSKTLKTYTDTSGFSFNYPDNLSLSSNELKEPASYAELQITAKEISGNLLLKIADSKFKNINEWVKSISSATPKEVMLGNLKAMEITTDSKILLGSLDSGVLFTIEVNLSDQKNLWMSTYSTLLKDFSFETPEDTTAQGVSSSEDVSFDGEEVVE